MRNKKKKIVFCASSGGHFEQLMMLKPLMEKFDSIIVTEKTKYNSKKSYEFATSYYLSQVNRKEKMFLPIMLKNLMSSIYLFAKEKPDVIICTGVLAMMPLCMIGKLFGKEVIYIESFAKVTSATETGKILYKYADRFYVQWESMLEVFPKATFKGSVY